MGLCYHCFQEKGKAAVCPFCGYDSTGAEKKYPLALKPGTILNGRYIVGRVLGQGGFGITYIAQDYRIKERVAIKEYFPSEFAGRGGSALSSVQVHSENQKENFEYGKAQFLEEAKTLAAFIGNEHIVRIYSYFEENDTAYFVMEYVDGYALDKYMTRKGGRLGVDEARRLLLPLMQSLDAVHAKGIIHRDIAPDNILITNDGTAKLIDFGAARYSTGEKSRSLDVILKHGFAPAEQYMRRGRQGPYTDVYALAATWYYTLTGKVLPDAVERMQNDTLLLPRTFGVKLSIQEEDVLLKALEVNAPDRYRNMDEFYRAMAEASGAGRDTPVPESHREQKTWSAVSVSSTGLTTAQTGPSALEEAALLEQRAREIRAEAERKEREEREGLARIEAERLEQERREREEQEKAALLERERKNREAREAEERRRQEAYAEAECQKKAREEQKARKRQKAKEKQAAEKVEAIKTADIEGSHKKSTQKKKAPRFVAIAAVLVAVVAIGFYLITDHPAKRSYSKGLQLMEAGRYSEAAAQFEAAGDYEDAARQVLAAHYAQGLACQEAGDWNEAAKAFILAKNYKDAPDRIQAIQQEIQYCDAEELLALGQYQEAFSVFEVLARSGYKDSAERAESIKNNPEFQAESWRDPKPGSTVYFGAYEQDNDLENGKEPIEWIVLDVQDNRTLLISKYALDFQPFNNNTGDTNWETCSLRTWLNSDFLSVAFSDEEINQILTTPVTVEVISDNQNSAMKTVKDKVFLLSCNEGQTLFGSDSLRHCDSTAYAQAIEDVDHRNYHSWWLRSVGKVWVHIMPYHYYGDAPYSYGTSLNYIYNGKEYAKNLVGVRPAIWVSLAS